MTENLPESNSSESQPGEGGVEAADGLSVLRGRMERGSRVVRPPRNPAGRPSPNAGVPVSSAPVGQQQNAITAPARPVQENHAATHVPHVERRDELNVAGEELTSNLAVRVRRSLDRRLDTLVHELKMSEVKSSKVEIVEMLLWELPASVDDQLRRRLREFRAATRRDW